MKLYHVYCEVSGTDYCTLIERLVVTRITRTCNGYFFFVILYVYHLYDDVRLKYMFQILKVILNISIYLLTVYIFLFWFYFILFFWYLDTAHHYFPLQVLIYHLFRNTNEEFLFVLCNSRRSGQYTMNHDDSKRIPDGASFDRSGSQDSLDAMSLDDFWKEVENIHETRGNNHEERQTIVVKEPDGNEKHCCEWSSFCLFGDFL